MNGTTEVDGSDEPNVETELDWQAHAVIEAIHDNGGTADTSEIRTITGIDDYNVVLYRLNEKLEPSGLVDLMQPDPDGGRPRAKVVTLTKRGKALAERLTADEDDSADDSPVSSVERIERLEAQMTAPYGSWDPENRQEYEYVVEGMVAMRDFLREKYGDEFEEYMTEQTTS
jgi:DNA-binding PadR family transcriptional regulator